MLAAPARQDAPHAVLKPSTSIQPCKGRSAARGQSGAFPAFALNRRRFALPQEHRRGGRLRHAGSPPAPCPAKR